MTGSVYHLPAAAPGALGEPEQAASETKRLRKPQAAQPAPLVRETPPAAPYPASALGPLRAVAEAVASLPQAPMALAAQSVLGAAALAVQGLADVETLAGPRPCSLFLLSVVKSGERKSTCDRLAMGAIREHERTLDELHREEKAEHEAALSVWAAQKAAAKTEAAADPVAAQAKLAALGLEPPAPLWPQIVAADPTIEGLVRNLPNMRASLGLLSDEAGSFLGGHGMSQEHRLKTMAGLSVFWDGAPINRTRGGDGAATYRGRRLSCHLMGQPSVIEPLLADPVANGQGFLARFLVCQPQSTIGTRLQRPADPAAREAIEAFADRLAVLLSRELPLREGSRNELDPPVLALSSEARVVLSGFADDVERDQAPDGELSGITPFASKAAEHAARIAGVLTLFADPAAEAVTGETMADAVTLTQHYVAEAKRLTDAAVIPPDVRDAEALREWLQDWPEDFVSVPDITQRGPNGLREAKRIKRLVRLLQEHHHLIPAGEQTILGRKRKEAWRIVRTEA